MAAVFQNYPELGALACNAWDMLPEGNHLHIKAANNEVLIIEDFFRAKRDGIMLVRTSGVAIRRSVIAGVGYMERTCSGGKTRSTGRDWRRLASVGASCPNLLCSMTRWEPDR